MQIAALFQLLASRKKWALTRTLSYSASLAWQPNSTIGNPLPSVATQQPRYEHQSFLHSLFEG
jgi:hypothetical protein